MEARNEWCHTMVKKMIQRQLWEYGVSWVSEVMNMTNNSQNSVNGGIPLTNVTGETIDIYEHLDFFKYEKAFFKDNTVQYPSEPRSWLWISRRTGRLICYHILTHKNKVHFIEWWYRQCSCLGHRHRSYQRKGRSR